jgi:DNA-directed RNA polymerase subunit M/transcription elongation factor TFIIS
VEDASIAMRLALMRMRFGHDDVKITNYSRDQAAQQAQARTSNGDGIASSSSSSSSGGSGRGRGSTASSSSSSSSSGSSGAVAPPRNLREGLLSGRILASSTPYLSAAELASQSVRESLAEIDAQADAKASFQKIMPEPGMFNCEKCGSDLVQHTTAQIMRADEAETVFLTCFNCDHKWALDRGF